MSDAQKKRAHVISAFKDEGTGQSFGAGDTPLMEAGQFENYKAAGLVEAAPAAVARPAAKPKPKAKTAQPSKPTRPSQPSQPAQTPTTGEGKAGA